MCTVLSGTSLVVRLSRQPGFHCCGFVWFLLMTLPPSTITLTATLLSSYAVSAG